jgi:3-hydroxyacyl-CoA dehydrogenase
MADLAGVDIGWHRDPKRIESVRDALCAQGRWGQKTKAGFYDYDEKRKPSPSPVVEEIVTAFRKASGTVPRSISDEEIVVRTLYSMVNEGDKILREGIAQRASDIDVVWLYGYGWPRHTGGPMFWAETIGIRTIVDGLQKYRDKLGPNFELSPTLVERAATGGKFT